MRSVARFISFAVLAVIPYVSDAAVKCGSVGDGAVAFNNGGGAVFALANGPYACVDGSLPIGFSHTAIHDQKDSSGSLVTINVEGTGATASGSTMLGSNHLSAGSVVGAPANADSEWADIGFVSLPGATGTVSITFTGHLTGTATLSTGAQDIASVNAFYWLEFANGGSGYFDDLISTTNEIRSGQSKNRNSSDISFQFTGIIQVPVNTPFGITSALSINVSKGGYADFSHTAALDAIFLPTGYTFLSHGVPLDYDGTAFHYPVAAVPEPSSFLLGSFGLVFLALCLGKHRSKSV